MTRIPAKPSSDAVPFEHTHDFDGLTRNAPAAAETLPEPHSALLRLLSDCENADSGALLCDQQERGAPYKQLAATGHKVGMSQEERVRCYRIAESVPLSCQHTGHMVFSKPKWGMS